MTYGDCVLTFREAVSRVLSALRLYGIQGSWDAGTDTGDLRRYRKARR